MKLTGLRLRLATSKLIRKWAKRKLPNGKKINGKILNPKTVNYQTFKPEKGGLFCERIFGPINDLICACGRPPLRGQKYCPRCEVEYISARVRRYRLGYIQLVTAVAHIWFFRGRPNYFSLFLNLPKKKVECLLYCTKNISRTIFVEEFESLNFHSIQIINNLLLRNLKIFNKDKFYYINKRVFWCKKKNYKNYDLLKYKFNFFCRKNISNLKNKLFLSFNISYSILEYTGKTLYSLNFIIFDIIQVYKQLVYIYLVNIKNSHVLFKLFIYTNIIIKKNLWYNGGLRDSAIYFGFLVISKMFSWYFVDNWFSFVYFIIKLPQKNDLLNKFYPGPPGIINFCGFRFRLFCFTGVQIIRTWLTQLTKNNCNNGRLLEIQIRLDLLLLNKYEPLSDNEFINKIQLFRRFKHLRLFRYTKINPASMILSVLPVLPPDLRPILQLDNHQIAVSDFNKLYQTILFRNKRLSKLTIDQNFNCLNSVTLQYAQRLLQESVDVLIENGKSDNLKSLSNLFRGKKGRFRQNLLGKRVDYSGRSVIVVGPYLKLYECGLPIEIAFELFQPFLLRLIMLKNKAKTILGAKKLLKKKPELILNFLKEIVCSHPILLNRAPTLHRLGIQAFKPCLVDGKAILLHPLVCSAFNADFDGDQMGVHIPLCFESRAESWKITWSQNNLFSVATGLPTCIPSQDIILGSSFLTTRNIQEFSFNLLKKNKILWNNIKFIFFEKPYFLKKNSRVKAPISIDCKNVILSNINFIYFSNKYYLERKNKTIYNINSNNQKSIWLSYNPILNKFETENKIQKVIEIRLNLRGNFQKFRPQVNQYYHYIGFEILRKFRTTFGRVKFSENL